MFYISHIVIGGALLLAALYVQKLKETAQAKQFSIHCSWLLLLAAVTSVVLTRLGVSNITFFGQGFLLANPVPFLDLFLCLVLTVSLSFASLKDHPVKIFSAILFLMACTHCQFSTEIFAIKLLANIGGTLAVVWCFHTSCKQESRIFSLYQYSGLLLLVAGLCLIKLAQLPEAGIGLVFLSIMVRQGILPFNSAYTHFLEKAPFGPGLLFGNLHLGTSAFLITGVNAHNNAFAFGLAIAASVTSVFASLIGLTQVKGRRSLSYLLLSQSGFMVFAWISSGNVSSALLLSWYSMAIATLGFAAMLHSIEIRRGHLNLNTGSGNYAHTPKMAIACLLLGFASVGFPLTLGFSAIEEILEQSFVLFPLATILCVLALAINSINVVRIFFLLFTGQRKNTYEPDLTPGENIAAIFSIAVLFLGSLISLH
ncbi:MAG TPA: proton-conducting transporter membrane subunit [Cellvibrio sp.]